MAWADLCTRRAAADRLPGVDPALAEAILAHYGGPRTPAAPPALQPVLQRLQTRPGE